MHTYMDMLYSGGCESIINLVEISNNKDLCCTAMDTTVLQYPKYPLHSVAHRGMPKII